MNPEKIKQLRKDFHLSQEDLAQQIGISRQTVCRWENGTAVLHKEDLENLCRVFGMTKGQLEEAAAADTANAEMATAETTSVNVAGAEVPPQLSAEQTARKKKRTKLLVALCIVLPILGIALYICGKIAFSSAEGYGTAIIRVLYFEPATVFWLLFAVFCGVLIAIIILLFLRGNKRRQKEKNKHLAQ